MAYLNNEKPWICTIFKLSNKEEVGVKFWPVLKQLVQKFYSVHRPSERLQFGSDSYFWSNNGTEIRHEIIGGTLASKTLELERTKS
jgi:hypothetical protein